LVKQLKALIGPNWDEATMYENLRATSLAPAAMLLAQLGG